MMDILKVKTKLMAVRQMLRDDSIDRVLIDKKIVEIISFIDNNPMDEKVYNDLEFDDI